MLWALLRLSVRDAGPQLRYCPVRRRPSGAFRAGLTRSDGAGTGSRARPESECDLPHEPRSQGAYTQQLYPETYDPITSCDRRDLACGRTANGPGNIPGPFG